MTSDDTGGNPLWDPFGLWRELTRATEQQWDAFTPPVVPTATVPLQWLLDLVRAKLVGRSVKLRVGGDELELKLEDLELHADPMQLAAGQAEKLTLKATDVTWGKHAFPAATATFHNVFTRAGQRAALLCAPVDLSLEIPEHALVERIGQRVPWLQVEIRKDGTLAARYRSRPRWGWMKAEISPQGSGVAAQLSEVTVFRRSHPLPRRLPPIHVSFGLPSDARLTAATARPGSIVVNIRLDQQRVEIKQLLSLLGLGKGTLPY